MATLPTTTVATYRNRTTALTGTVVVLDAGIPSFWQPAPEDTTTPDNGGTFLRTKKKHGLRRLYEGIPKAAWFGMVPGTEVSRPLQAYINALPASQYYLDLEFETGRYRWETTVDTNKTGLGLVCAHGMAQFVGSVPGNMLRISGSSVTNLFRVGWFGDGYRELLDEKGQLVEDVRHQYYKDRALVYATGAVDIDDCGFQESSGHLVFMEGYLDGNRTNVSGSRIRNSYFGRSGGAPIYIEGADASALVIEANDLRDNCHPYTDNGFLGSFFAFNMLHNNKLRHTQVLSESSMAVIAFNYMESGSPPDLLGGNTTAIGNRHSGRPRTFGNPSIQNPADNYVLRADENGNLGVWVKWRERPIAQFIPAGMNVSLPFTAQGRPAPADCVSFSCFGVDGTFTYVAQSLEQAQKLDYTWRAGDRVVVLDLATGKATTYQCTVGGNGGRTLEGVYGAVSPDTSGNLVVTGNTDQIHPGDILRVVAIEGEKPVLVDVLISKVNETKQFGLVASSAAKIRTLATPQALQLAAPMFFAI